MTLTDNMRGAGLMTVAMVVFTFNDAFMKSVTTDMGVFQAMFLRGVLSSAALAAIGVWQGSLHLRLAPQDRFWIALRTLGEVAATFLFLLALKHMHIANLSAILQALPLAVTLTAALTMGQHIGWRRLLAITVGFAGVLIIIRPGSEAFDRWSLLGVGSMLCVILRDLATRQIADRIPSVTVAFLAALSVAVGAALMLPFTGVSAVSGLQAAKIAGASAFLIMGYLTVVMSMRVGEVSYVAPFRYMSLLAAILLGWLVFGNFPDQWTLIGSAIVVVTGVYTFHRERILARVRAG